MVSEKCVHILRIFQSNILLQINFITLLTNLFILLLLLLLLLLIPLKMNFILFLSFAAAQIPQRGSKYNWMKHVKLLIFFCFIDENLSKIYFVCAPSRYSINWMQAKGGAAGDCWTFILTKETATCFHWPSTTYTAGNIQGIILLNLHNFLKLKIFFEFRTMPHHRT